MVGAVAAAAAAAVVAGGGAVGGADSCGPSVFCGTWWWKGGR